MSFRYWLDGNPRDEGDVKHRANRYDFPIDITYVCNSEGGMDILARTGDKLCVLRRVSYPSPENIGFESDRIERRKRFERDYYTSILELAGRFKGKVTINGHSRNETARRLSELFKDEE